MNPYALLSALLRASLAASIAGVCLVAPATYVLAQPVANWVVTGRLVRPDGSPLAGIDVGLYEASARGYTVKVGAGGVILNPIATSDSAGRFAIQAKHGIFTGNRFVVLASIGSRWQPLVDNKDVPVVLDVRDNVTFVSLGDVSAK